MSEPQMCRCRHDEDWHYEDETIAVEGSPARVIRRYGRGPCHHPFSRRCCACIRFEAKMPAMVPSDRGQALLGVLLAAVMTALTVWALATIPTPAPASIWRSGEICTVTWPTIDQARIQWEGSCNRAATWMLANSPRPSRPETTVQPLHGKRCHPSAIKICTLQ